MRIVPAGPSAPYMLFRLLACTFLILIGALSVRGANVPPEYLAAGASGNFRSGGTIQTFEMRELFRDPDVMGSAVRMRVRIGDTYKFVDIALYDQQTPITVANFLAYVNSGRHNANMVHRSMPGFVVQGGGFAWSPTNSLNSVVTFPQIQNEPGISNLRGTIAMAKLGDNPNSATSQWFVNLADNSTNLDAQNGGFTVFGRVVGNGMTVIDEIAALDTYNAGGAFDNLPLKNYTTGSVQRVHTVETDSAVIPTLSFAAVSGNPQLVEAVVIDSTLVLAPSLNSSGTTTVLLTATDLDGATTQALLTVTIFPKSAGWHVANNPSGQPETFTLTPTDLTPLPADPVPVGFGSLAIGSPVSKSFTITNNGAIPLPNFAATLSGASAADYEILEGSGPSTLAAGASRTVTVRLTPTTGGARNATLTLASDHPDLASLQVSLTATGIDTVAPTLSQPAPQAITANAMRLAEVPDLRNTLVTALDNIGVTSFTQSPAPGSILQIGEYALVFTAADAAGNTATVQTTLTVQYDEETLPEVLLTEAREGAAVPSNASASLPSGSVLSAFGTPAISDDRAIAARVTITAVRTKLAGVYFEDAEGNNRLVAYQGQESGVAGATFKSFRDPLISRDGAVAFGATLAGARSRENEGVWTDLFGNLQHVLRKGSEIPGLTDPGLKLKSVTSLSFDDDALFAVVKILPVRGLVTGANDTALIRITGTGATKLARTGDDFEGSKIKQVSVLQPAARSVGQGRWTSGNSTVVKLTLLTKQTVIARIGQDGTSVALLHTGVLESNLGMTLKTLGLPSIGGQGVALLAMRLAQPGLVSATNDSVILFAPDGSSFAPAVHEEPGLAKFASFSDPVTNDQGDVLFYGAQRAPEARKPNVTALWLTNGTGAPAIVARVGGAATNADGQPLENTTWSGFPSFALPDGPGAGPIFVGQLSGRGVTGGSKLGLWAVDSGSVVRMILRTGQDVVTPTGTKRVASFTVLNSLPGSFGARRSYNATGAVAVQATFTDRSQAILRLDVP